MAAPHRPFNRSPDRPARCIVRRWAQNARVLVAWALVAIAPATAMSQATAAEPTKPEPHSVPDTMQQRLLACTGCHGKDGRATASGYFPRIAGKPEGYLFNQLKNFSEGRRQNATMSALLEHMSDDYLHQIAAYFAALDLPYAMPPPVPAGTARASVVLAKKLVTSGDPNRQLPACAECHGAALTGLQPDVPGLLGLPRDYLISQLGAWQTGLRQAQAPDCMATVARKLSAEEVAAVATWLAAQVVPMPAQAASKGTQQLPLHCGPAQR